MRSQVMDAQSPKAAEHHRTATLPTKSCGWRGDCRRLNGATITIADGATSGTTTAPASDDVYVVRHGFRDYH
ncbi:hypothetical protein OK016_19410 [Vibrio chagasii]|nr:hypothetical protein [Vibrio chagasii]